MSFIGNLGSAMSSVGSSVINFADKGKEMTAGLSQLAGSASGIASQVKEENSFSETMDLVRLSLEMAGLVADIAKPIAEMTVIVGEGITIVDAEIFGGSQAKVANQSLVLV